MKNWKKYLYRYVGLIYMLNELKGIKDDDYYKKEKRRKRLQYLSSDDEVGKWIGNHFDGVWTIAFVVVFLLFWWAWPIYLIYYDVLKKH